MPIKTVICERCRVYAVRETHILAVIGGKMIATDQGSKSAVLENVPARGRLGAPPTDVHASDGQFALKEILSLPRRLARYGFGWWRLYRRAAREHGYTTDQVDAIPPEYMAEIIRLERILFGNE